MRNNVHQYQIINFTFYVTYRTISNFPDQTGYNSRSKGAERSSVNLTSKDLLVPTNLYKEVNQVILVERTDYPSKQEEEVKSADEVAVEKPSWSLTELHQGSGKFPKI